jgi:hypothetical protein
MKTQRISGIGALLWAAALGCGSDVAVPGEPASGGASVSSSATASSATGGAGGSEVSPCAGAECGMACHVCNDIDCFPGVCGEGGSRASGGGGPSADCPPSQDVVAGAACDLPEGTYCASRESCSGYLACIEGYFVLMNPC